jgi:hypothetical protein
VLSLKKNSLCTNEAGKVLGEMLKVNSVLKELDLSDNHGGDPVGFAQELALGIKDNGAMTRLNISNIQLCGHWKTPDFSGFKALAAAIEQHKLLTMDTVDMSEALDVSNQNLGTAGAKMMATFINGNVPMTSLSLANSLGVAEAKIIAAVLPKCT